MRNPFRPGAGRPPPLRTGHEDAAEYLADRLEDIREGEGGDTVVLFGPRGNGKTVLLGELRKRAKDRKVRVIVLRPGDMVGGAVTLAGLLAAETASRRPRVMEAKAGAFEVGAGVAPGDLREPSPRNALRRYLDRPLLLMVDEAHEMPSDLGNALLQATQDCISDGLPLLFALAGTPNLPSRLRNMNASFWERCEKLRIGRLESEEAVRDALVIPARSSGMPIDEDAMEPLVKESQRYPFFVQTLGFEAWNAARKRKGDRRITLEDAHRGITKSRVKLRMFHDGRRIEAGRQNILGEAEAVSRMAVAKGPDARFTMSELVAALESAAIPNGRESGEALEKLTHLGLVWQVSETNLWEPGIPSLCAYLVEMQGVPVLG